MKLNPFALMREEMDGTGVVFNPESNRAMTLNRTGVLIWKTLASNGQREDIVKALLASYRVSPEQASADVDAFLVLLREKGLLEEA